MSKKTNPEVNPATHSATYSAARRQFLKGTAYASAVSIGSLSGLAFANSASKLKQDGISGEVSTVTLSNQSNRAIVLDAAQPVSLEKVHGWVVVKINKTPQQSAADISSGDGIVFAAGEQRSFAVDAELAPALREAGGHIVITNEFSALDNMVPMATYDVVVA